MTPEQTQAHNARIARIRRQVAIEERKKDVRVPKPERVYVRGPYGRRRVRFDTPNIAEQMHGP